MPVSERGGVHRLPLYGSQSHLDDPQVSSVNVLMPDVRKPPEAVSAPGAIKARRTLYLDIESSPNLGYVWQVWKTDVIREGLVFPQEVICFVAKWEDEDDPYFYSVYHDGKEPMLDALWHLLDEADVVCHYNGNSYDIPHINREFILSNRTPPSPYKNLDLYLTVRRKFNFTYNSLDHVSKQLGLSGKAESGGFSTWLGCMQNDPDSWEHMRAYNIQDVMVLQELHKKLLPWISNHPSAAMYMDDFVCPNCGSDDLQRRGLSYTNAASYQRFVCNDCGKWSRDSKKHGDTSRIRSDANG